MLEPAITEETIKRLVDAFYEKVRSDAVLAPIFITIMGESDADWKEHLQVMYAFWSSVMLTSGRYRGNPLQKHKDLPAFDITLFDRWLALFEQTAQELHTPDTAAQYVAKSRRIAESLKLGIYYKSGDFPIVRPA